MVFNQGNSVVCEKPDNSANEEILKTLFDIKESINKLIDDDFSRSIVKSTNDTLAALNTNYELMKADINKYDALLTTHITQSSTNATMAIEKEHTRFVQKMSSDVNVIIAGITEANIAELATQATVVQTSMRELMINHLNGLISSLLWGLVHYLHALFLVQLGQLIKLFVMPMYLK